MVAGELIISHLYQDKESGQWITQTNEEHQEGVAKMAASFAGEFGLPSWGYVLGLLHDKGKERAAFQQYIRRTNGLLTEDKKQYDNHAHAFVGGILAKELKTGRKVATPLSAKRFFENQKLEGKI